MPQCTGIKVNGERCTNNTPIGETRCRVRHRTYLEDEPEIRNENVPVLRNELAEFAADRQNVHTSRIVHGTKKTIGAILNHCPNAGANANKRVFTDIIMCCPFTVRALLTFTDRYWHIHEDIYEMGPGIYAKVTNAIWDFACKSSYKDDICTIFASELDDSVGMCAQGALSRLCNVLSGYMDGIGDQRSTKEIVGDLFFALSNNTSIGLYSKLQDGAKILIDNDIPKEEWLAWLDTLIDEDTDGDFYIAWKYSNEL